MGISQNVPDVEPYKKLSPNNQGKISRRPRTFIFSDGGRRGLCHHTITYDNGREFADHEGMASDLEADIYFAHPYSSWERGVNENTNGLIRQYFPKNRNLTTVTNKEIKHAMDKLNHPDPKTGHGGLISTFKKG